MGKKKRTFIDKKKAETYHLVRRSQRDVGGYFDEETGEPLDVPKEFILLPDAPTHDRLTTTTTSVAKKSSSTIDANHHPQQPNPSKDPLYRAKHQLHSAGLLDEYDYEQHFKPITGSGVFLSSQDAPMPVPQRSLYVPDDDIPSHPHQPPPPPPRHTSSSTKDTVRELDRQLDSIAVSADCMDEDMAQALFGNFDEGSFEEILDDFCLTADEVPSPNDNDPDHDPDHDHNDEKKVTSASNPSFDFDQHVRDLIAKAKREENGGGRIVPQDHAAWGEQQKEFQNAKPRRLVSLEDEEDDDESVDSWDEEFGREDNDDLDTGPTHTTTAQLSNEDYDEQQRILCEKFEETLLEYDSDNIGDLDDQYQTVVGDKPLEGDAYIDSAVNQFLADRADGLYSEANNHNNHMGQAPQRIGGSSYILVGNKRCDPSSEEVLQAIRNEETEKLEDTLRAADEVLARGESDLPPEEVLIDGKSYFDIKERNPWDCESILSTYSNLDNNPAVIGRSSGGRRGRERRKKKTEGNKSSGGDGDGEGPVQIMLSEKTGLPLGLYEHEEGNEHEHDGTYYEDQTFISVNKGMARKKNESKEEKRLRKKVVKEERVIARMQKKMMREAIDDEFRKHAGSAVSDDVAGKSVFRF